MNNGGLLHASKGLFATAFALGLAICLAEFILSRLNLNVAKYAVLGFVIHWIVFAGLSLLVLHYYVKSQLRNFAKPLEMLSSNDFQKCEDEPENVVKLRNSLDVVPVLTNLSHAHLEDSIRISHESIDFMNNKFSEEEQRSSAEIFAFVDTKIRSENYYENAKKMFSDNRRLLEKVSDYKQNRLDEISGDTEVVTRVIAMMDRLIPQVALIRELTKKTRLLAFNAAIQAARDDTVGRIFVVVAEEMRHLAVQSESTTNQVNEIVLQICDTTKERLGSMVSPQRINTEVQWLEALLSSISSMTSNFEIAISDLDVLSNYAQKTSKKIFDTVADVQHLAQLQDMSRQQIELVQSILSDCGMGVEQVKMALVEELPANQEFLLDNIISDLERRYTMNSQNQIHKRVLYGITEESAPVPSVELF